MLYTDGITEARQRGGEEEFGETRLIELALANRHAPPQTLVDAVFAAVEGFTGTATPEDDQTVVVVKRRGAHKGSNSS